VTATEAVPDCEELAALVAPIVCVPTALPGEYSPLALIVPAAASPPATPSTLHLAAALPGTVAVNCCFCARVSGANCGTMLTTFELVTVTDAVSDLLPPDPVQVSV
jgi:hypothetical protein